MRRVSSKATLYYKRIFPILFFGFLFLVTLGPELMAMLTESKAARPPPLLFLIFPAALAAFAYVIMKRLVFDLVDEVWDDGDSLIVRNAGREERIALTDIRNVSYSVLTNPPRVTLSLRQPTNFGSEVTFCAPLRLIPFSTSPIINDLIDRIDAKRRR
jgi:hypothetical protein